MAKKLYVGSLAYTTDQEGLKKAFGECGTVVSATVIMDRDTGRSKGFGFVEMSTDEEAAAAIERWNGQELEGRKLIVNEARPMEGKPRGNFNRDGGSGRGDRW